MNGKRFWMVAAGLLYFCLKRWREVAVVPARAAAASFAAVVIALLGGPSASVGAAQADLQTRIDAATAGAVIRVDGGAHVGSLSIDKPLSLVGVGRPVVSGDGRGSVIEVSGNGPIPSGFVSRAGSGGPL